MAKAEKVHANFISQKLSKTHNHLQRVQEKKMKHMDLSKDHIAQTGHIRSLTQKYERSKKIEQDIEAKKTRIHMNRVSKEERAKNNLLHKNKEERERIKYLKKKMAEKEESG